MAANPDNFPYFSLPGEVRNQIMNHVLSHVEGEVCIPTAIPSQVSKRLKASLRENSSPGIQLLATCKQALMEGAAIFYPTNKFRSPARFLRRHVLVVEQSPTRPQESSQKN